MTTDTRAAGPHLDDGELGRYLDAECEPLERGRIEAHLAACAECSGSLEAARAWSEGFAKLLVPTEALVRELPPLPSLPTARERSAAPSRPRVPPALLRAAAIALVALGVSLSAAPVRAWVAERWTDLRTLAGPLAPEAAGEETGTSRPEGAVVSFVPAGDDFLLEFDASPAGGSLTVRIEEVSTVSVQVVGGMDDVELVVLGHGVRVRYAAGSSADYRVVLPAKLRTLRVQVAGTVVREYPLRQGEQPAEWSLPLGGGSR